MLCLYQGRFDPVKIEITLLKKERNYIAIYRESLKKLKFELILSIVHHNPSSQVLKNQYHSSNTGIWEPELS